MNWRTAKSLLALLDQINRLYPNRSKTADGTIGDLAHQKVASDHNPNAQGVVTALDVTYDLKNGPDLNWLADYLIKDARTKYVIYNRRIWELGQWKPYNGVDPHTGHLHVSVKASNADITSPWRLEEEEMAKPSDKEVRSAALTYAQKFTDAQVKYYTERSWENLLNDLLPAVNAERLALQEQVSVLNGQLSGADKSLAEKATKYDQLKQLLS